MQTVIMEEKLSFPACAKIKKKFSLCSLLVFHISTCGLSSKCLKNDTKPNKMPELCPQGCFLLCILIMFW